MSSRPTRVCFPFVGDSIGGAQISALILARALKGTAYSPVLVVHEEGPLLEHLRATNDLEFDYLPIRHYVGVHSGVVPNIAAVVGSIRELRGWIGRASIGIVHAQDARMDMTWALPARAAGVKFVWHQRSHFSQQRLMSLLIRCAHKVVSISATVAASVPVPSLTVPNPFVDPRAKHGAEVGGVFRRWGIQPDDRVIGLFGNITRQKRATLVVKALPFVRALSPAHVLIFGSDREGVIPELLELAEQLDVASFVHYAGFVNDPDAFMAACDVVVAPAVDEGFGRTVVEAMLNGVPVIASSSGGHLEIIKDGETGVLVEPDNAAALAEAICELLSDPERAALIADQGRQDALSRFGVQRHVDAIVNLYDALK